MQGSSPSQAPADHAHLSDREIVERVRGGDAAIYEVLMRRHNQLLYRSVRSVLRDENEVEDVLQETYLAAFAHLDQFMGRAQFSTWLVRIALNRATDRLRRRARLVDLGSEEAVLKRADAELAATPLLGSRRPDPERASASRELAALLADAIDALPAAYRSVYVLREVEGMTTEETASSLGLEAGTVKTRLHRARAMLRDRLYERAGDSAKLAFTFGAERCDRVVAAVLGRLSGPV